MKDSVGFMFNDIHSSAFGVMSVHDSNGSLYEDTMKFTHNLQESNQLNGNVISTKETIMPIEFSLTLYFDTSQKTTGVREIIRWLKTDSFKPLVFDSYANIVVYAKAKNFSNINHNGVSQGLITVDFITNSGYLYSPPILTSVYNVQDSLDIMLNNDGDETIYPKIWIKKEGKGEISIINNNTQENFVISEANNNEKIFVDGEKRIIFSNQEIVGNFRGVQHNRVWLPLQIGIFDGTNSITIKGSGQYQFELQYKFLSML